RSHSNIIPTIANDRTQTLWFRQDDFTTRHGFQLDIIRPYKPDDFTAPFFNLGATATWLDQGVCSAGTQQVNVSITAMPPDATQVRYIISGLTNFTSPFG